MKAHSQKLKVVLNQNLVLALIETMPRKGSTLTNLDGVDTNFVDSTVLVWDFGVFGVFCFFEM